MSFFVEVCFLILIVSFKDLTTVPVTTVSVPPSCSSSMVSINRYSNSSPAPTTIKRFELIGIEANIVVSCTGTFQISKQWSALDLNSQKAVDLSSNPTQSSSTLIVEPNVMNFGRYEFILTVTVTLDATQTTFVLSASAFINVEPSGIVVRGLINGLQQTSIGTSQSIKIQPNVYSYDMDNLVSATSLSFKYYCRKYENGTYGAYPLDGFGNQIDLKQLQTSWTIQDCFSSLYQYSFDPAGSLVINGGALQHASTRLYVFCLETTYNSRVYSQYVSIQVEPTSTKIPLNTQK